MMSMCSEFELRMQEAAMREPAQALLVLGVTIESSPHAVKEVFMEAYVKVNGGNPKLQVSHDNVNRVVLLWLQERKIESWLARACVLEQLERESVD
jgi:hypothetical protein